MLSRVKRNGTTYGTYVGIICPVVYTFGVDVEAEMLLKEFWGEAYAHVGALVVAFFQCGFIVIVTDTDTVRKLFGLTINADVLVGGESSPVNQVLPVGIGVSHQGLYAG